jgi:phosphonoacetaldehyde hydrolase
MIPGVLKTIQKLKADHGIKIGATTGYLSDMIAIVKVQAEKQGYEPDSTVCASDVPAGRPEPWMAIKNAQNLRVFPFEACVKVDDTLPGIEEGLNAGMWTIGVAKTGNEMGLTEEEVNALDPADLDHRLQRIRATFAKVGAHYVVDSAAGKSKELPRSLSDPLFLDIIPIIEQINQRLARGEKP